MAFDETKWKEWFDGLDATAQSLVNERFQALENTVKSTRTERDSAKNSLGGVTRKANFFEQASTMNCRNPKVAYALAVTDNLFTEDGSPDWDKVKAAYPEGFQTANANTKAGNGTQTTTKLSDANDAFRNANKRN